MLVFDGSVDEWDRFATRRVAAAGTDGESTDPGGEVS
jgi:hypothetical protein